VVFDQPIVLGRTGLRVSRLGIGASYGVGAAAIERAFHEHGVNVFYWGSIRRAGMREAVRRLARADRDRIVVALQSYDRSGVFLKPMFERGCHALGLDRADLLILGWHQSRPSSRILDAALDLKSRGRVRFLALSGHHRPLIGELAADPAQPFDVLLFRYNAVHRGAETEILPRLGGEGRPGTVAYTATCWGRLLDPKRMPLGEPPPRAADCYRFALSDPRVDAVLCGPKDDGELDEAVRTLDLGPLDPGVVERLRRIGDHIHGGA
jgi:aryl-alcohol dehydrogenase-like predicted oxidoreductase